MWNRTLKRWVTTDGTQFTNSEWNTKNIFSDSWANTEAEPLLGEELGEEMGLEIGEFGELTELGDVAVGIGEIAEVGIGAALAGAGLSMAGSIGAMDSADAKRGTTSWTSPAGDASEGLTSFTEGDELGQIEYGKYAIVYNEYDNTRLFWEDPRVVRIVQGGVLNVSLVDDAGSFYDVSSPNTILTDDKELYLKKKTEYEGILREGVENIYEGESRAIVVNINDKYYEGDIQRHLDDDIVQVRYIDNDGDAKIIKVPSTEIEPQGLIRLMLDGMQEGDSVLIENEWRLYERYDDSYVYFKDGKILGNYDETKYLIRSGILAGKGTLPNKEALPMKSYDRAFRKSDEYLYGDEMRPGFKVYSPREAHHGEFVWRTVSLVADNRILWYNGDITYLDKTFLYKIISQREYDNNTITIDPATITPKEEPKVDLSSIHSWKTLLTYEEDKSLVSVESIVVKNKNTGISVIFDMTNKIMICIIPKNLKPTKRRLEEEEEIELEDITAAPTEESDTLSNLVRHGVAFLTTGSLSWLSAESVYYNIGSIGKLINYTWDTFYSFLTLINLNMDNAGYGVGGAADYIAQDPTFYEYVRYEYNYLLPTAMYIRNMAQNIQVATLNKYVIPFLFLGVLFATVDVIVYRKPSLGLELMKNTGKQIVVTTTNVVKGAYNFIYNLPAVKAAGDVTEKEYKDVKGAVSKGFDKVTSAAAIGIVIWFAIKGYK